MLEIPGYLYRSASEYYLRDIHCATISTFGGEDHTRVPYHWPASVTTYMAIALTLNYLGIRPPTLGFVAYTNP